MEMKKSELRGDFFTRLKLEYREAEMERMTPWSLFVCKLISCTPNSGQDNSYLRTKLLDMYRDNPDPTEADLDKFERIIREHESMVTAREFKGEVPANVRIIRTDNIPQAGEKFHKLCGKTHAKKECKQQCYGCNMYGSHLPQDCWELYPDKKPKFTTPRKNRKGRGRERSRSKSEGKGEKDKKDKKDERENSPHSRRTSRVATDRDR